MRVFLTGGSGMVGRNVVEHAAAADHELISPSSRELDLRDAKAVEAFLRDVRPDIVFHAAGRVGGIQANMREPVGFLVDNLDMGRNIVLGARAAGVTRLINLGSSCMFPRDTRNPIPEEAMLTGTLEPTNEGYAIAKIATARLCQYIATETPEFQYKTLLPCNLYGRHDKFDPKHSHMVPAIIHKLHQAKVAGVQEVDIWGDGTARREFMYAGDLADCLWRTLDHFQELPTLMNVGLGRDLAVNDYYRVAAEVVGYQGKFVHDLTKPVGMKQKLVDVSRASAWGWQAKTSIEEGLRLTYQHYIQDIAT
jgi:GDP-L-fucose synthase